MQSGIVPLLIPPNLSQDEYIQVTPDSAGWELGEQVNEPYVSESLIIMRGRLIVRRSTAPLSVS